MALLFAEGFDHYGGDITNMTKGAWNAYQLGTLELSAAQSRTGTYSLHSLSISGSRSSEVSKTFGGGDNFAGIALGYYPLALDETAMTQFNLLQNNGDVICQIKVLQSGALQINKAVDSLNIGTTAPVIVANAWNHIEFQFRASTVIGSVEIRVNGVIVFSLTNIDTGTAIPTILKLGGSSIYTDNNFYDDIVIYNSLTAFNNTWLGVVRVTTVFPDTNSTPQDWATVGAASAVLAINGSSPTPASYINSALVGNNSKFTLADLPAEISAIAGIYVPTHAKSDQAGLSQIQVKIQSGAKVETGPVLNLLPNFTYQGSIFQNNWTRSEFDAATINFEKVG